MRHSQLLALFGPVLFLVACGAAPATEEKVPEPGEPATSEPPPPAEPASPAVPPELESVELARAAYLEAHVLPSDATVDQLKVRIGEKSAAMNDLTTRYAAARDAGPEVAAMAAARAGFLYLNFGCELATTTPGAESPEERASWQSAMDAKANVVIERGMGAMKEAADSAVLPWSDDADQALQLWYSVQGKVPVAEICLANEALWRSQ